jgi:hypothetical protein
MNKLVDYSDFWSLVEKTDFHKSITAEQKQSLMVILLRAWEHDWPEITEANSAE